MGIDDNLTCRSKFYRCCFVIKCTMALLFVPCPPAKEFHSFSLRLRTRKLHKVKFHSFRVVN